MKAYLKYQGFTKFIDIPKASKQIAMLASPTPDFGTLTYDPRATIEVTKLLFDYSHSEFLDGEEIAIYNYAGEQK